MTMVFCLSAIEKLRDLEDYAQNEISIFWTFLGSSSQLVLKLFSRKYKVFSIRVLKHDYQCFKNLNRKIVHSYNILEFHPAKLVIFRSFACTKYIFVYFYCVHLHPIDWE